MKKIYVLIIVFITSISCIHSQIYLAKTCEISFFSASPLENIEAINKAAKPLINTATNDVQIKIAISAFVFPKPHRAIRQTGIFADRSASSVYAFADWFAAGRGFAGSAGGTPC